MYKDFKIAVVVPAFNEEVLIIETLESVPDYVDKIYVINDCSSDNTLSLLNIFSAKNNKIDVINHKVNCLYLVQKYYSLVCTANTQLSKRALMFMSLADI